MKKKHLLYSAIISMGLLSSSCSDYLSVEGKLENTSQNLEKIFESEDFTEQWLAQAYSFLTKHNIDIHGRNLCMTNFADDMVYSEGQMEYRKFKYAEYDEGWWQNSWGEAYNGRTRQTLWSAVQMLTQKLCCQTIHDCPKVVPLHYESE